MEIDKGDIVIAVLPGDYGKGRPALVVQSNAFNGTHASIVVCPITSYLVATPLFRLRLMPSTRSGVEKASEIMIDKVMAIKRERITRVIGRLDSLELDQVNDALRIWLDLA